MQEKHLRPLVAGLGIGTLVFGIAPALAPRWFARLFGLPEPDAALAVVFRSVGLRDVVVGLGLWSAAARDGHSAPWLLARTLIDGGDTVAVALAVITGARQPRFLALGALALGAAIVDAALYLATRQAATPQPR